MLYPYALILPVGSFSFTLHVVVSLSVLYVLQSYLLPVEQTVVFAGVVVVRCTIAVHEIDRRRALAHLPVLVRR